MGIYVYNAEKMSERVGLCGGHFDALALDGYPLDAQGADDCQRTHGDRDVVSICQCVIVGV